MSTIRVAKRHRFAVVDRRAINDTRLSWSARGLLVWALDKPDDFELTREELAKQAPEGETAVRRMLKELSTYGYLRRERRRDEAGHFVTETTLYEVPPDEAQPLDGFPPVGNPPVGGPPVVNPPVRDRRLTTEETDTTANAVGNGVAVRDADAELSHSRLFAAVAEVWTGHPWPIDISERSRGYISSALPDLLALGASYEEVHRRGENYRRHYDGKRPTPAALVKHWPALDSAPSAAMRGTNRSLANGARWLASKKGER